MSVGRIRTARVYDPPVRGQGHRVLVMRLWPRGISKAKVDRWLRELAPVLPLMRGYLGGQLSWEEYRPQYLAGLERPEARAHVEEILGLARAGGVTLLCGCAELRRCHRSLLQQYLAERV